MRGKEDIDHQYPDINLDNDFKGLLRYINFLASHKLGYPVSLLSYLGLINNRSLGIEPNSLANILLNNVGDPYKDSETSLMEVKKHERAVIRMLEHYFGLKEGDTRGYVTSGGTEGNFAAMWWSKRYLINMGVENIIQYDNQIKLLTKQEKELLVTLPRISTNQLQERITLLQKLIEIKNKVLENKNIIQQMIIPTVFYSKVGTHYSIGKIAEILRLNIKAVESNADGSIDINSFKKELLFNLQAFPHSPVIVIANIGTTVTGAIDDVPSIKSILEKSHPKPIYTIHLDGALTGFVMPILKPFGEVKNYLDGIGANTIAVSAHKFPGLSQPSGIVLALKQFFEKAFEKNDRSIEYVGNILDVTITGSRSGLNVLMFYNALKTLGLDNKHAKLISLVKENMKNAKYLSQRLIGIFGSKEVYYPYHFNVSFPKPSTKLSKKYQLMLTGDKATICVLSNVNKRLIDQFINDLKQELKEKTMKNSPSDIKIMPLTEEYTKGAKDLLIKTFCTSEPITKHLNITFSEYEPFANEVIQKAIKDGLSKVAVDEKNKVVACVISEDISDPFIPKLTHYSKLKPIFGLIAELSKPFLQGKRFKKGKIFHQWLSMVDPEYRGQGLSTEIGMSTIEGAARKGFDYAYAEFTNELSEKITHQFNVLKLLKRIKLNDFKYHNEYPFKGLEGSATCYVATIRPGVKLEGLENTYSIEERL